MTEDKDFFATVGGDDPFLDPVEERDPARRLRGRLAAPVTVWTTGVDGERHGVTVSSVVVCEGDPPNLVGLLNPLGDFIDALGRSGSFVVHVLAEADRHLADLFSGRLLSPDPWEELPVTDGPAGPVIAGPRSIVRCHLLRTERLGDQELVIAAIDAIELDDTSAPLLYLRGRYRRVVPRGS